MTAGELVSPPVYYSFHGCRYRTKAALREPLLRWRGNASQLEQTKNGQLFSGATRDDEDYFLIKNNFCLRGLERTAITPYRVPKTLAWQNVSNFGAATRLK